MSTPLITTLLESSGFLQDQDWHQTAQLMNLAAKEIESLNERIAELGIVAMACSGTGGDGEIVGIGLPGQIAVARRIHGKRICRGLAVDRETSRISRSTCPGPTPVYR